MIGFYNQTQIIVILLLLLFRALFINTIVLNMEATSFEYSTKNIPLPSEDSYRVKLIERTEQLCRRMRWKAYFYLNSDNCSKETFGFKSNQTPPPITEMAKFEKRMTNMIRNIKFT